jgi:hypothetical protein
MAGYLIQVGATVLCAHGGQAQATVPSARVKLGGQPATTQPSPWTVSGCSMPPPPSGNGPCVTASWTTGSLRVTSGGQPLLLQDSTASCVPTGTPLTVAVTQMRVKGT